MKNLEILAPAGNMENLNTAINCGADAVYLGLQNFNARMSADNFTTENIAEVVKKCHALNVKVYVTVNTLVSNEEMPQMIETVRACVEAKVDAYLVQDLGVFSVLKSCFPGICLHASTQLGIHNLKGAKMAEELGFSRIVLSREAKLSDIIEIKKNTNLEIEYFVQGALCIAFSGNCYFSGMVLGESGNRGRCKQFCRMKYKISPDGKEEYLLSARDLCLLENLKTLIDAGVSSFKIEGRLRHSGYVAESVLAYKNAIASIQKGIIPNFEEEKVKLTKVFSRGAFLENAYLFDGVPDNVVNKKLQNHSGIKIGKVLKVEPFKDLFRLTLQSSHTLSTGDGLKFFDGEIEVQSLGVGNVDVLGGGKYQIYTKKKLKPNLDVNLILDYKMEDELLKTTKKLVFSAEIFANAQKPLSVNLKYNNKTYEFVSNFLPEKAKTSKTEVEEIKTQFSKLGQTHFALDEIKVFCDDVFLPKSVLNNFRREAIEFLNNQIIFENEKQIKASVCEENIKNYLSLMETKNVSVPFKTICVVNEENMDYVTKSPDILFAFEPQNWNEVAVQSFIEKFKGFCVGIVLPNLVNGKDAKLFDQILDNNKNLFVISNNLYGMSYAKTHNVICGIEMNVFNDFTISFLQKLGAKACVISIEQQKENIKSFENNFCYALGYAPLMTFAHCPYKTVNGGSCENCSYDGKLTFFDVKNNAHRIVRRRLTQCYFTLYHSHLTNNLGYINSLKYIDLNLLSESQIKLVFDALLSNKKVRLTNKDVFGKLNHQVK